MNEIGQRLLRAASDRGVTENALRSAAALAIPSAMNAEVEARRDLEGVPKTSPRWILLRERHARLAAELAALRDLDEGELP